jgi:hypothetical protein
MAKKAPKKGGGKAMEASQSAPARKLGRPKTLGPVWSDSRQRWWAWIGPRKLTAPAEIGRAAPGEAMRWYRATMRKHGVPIELQPTLAATGGGTVTVTLPGNSMEQLDELMPVIAAEHLLPSVGPSYTFRILIHEAWVARCKPKAGKG